MMKDWLRKIQGRLKKSEKQKILEPRIKLDAQKILSSSPVKDYLMALMDELIRQGIYLSKEDQIGARFTISLLHKEIEKGETIWRKENEKKK